MWRCGIRIGVVNPRYKIRRMCGYSRGFTQSRIIRLPDIDPSFTFMSHFRSPLFSRMISTNIRLLRILLVVRIRKFTNYQCSSRFSTASLSIAANDAHKYAPIPDTSRSARRRAMHRNNFHRLNFRISSSKYLVRIGYITSFQLDSQSI